MRGVDVKAPEFAETAADEFLLLDLRDADRLRARSQVDGGFDEVYQLAADMGGMGFIHSAECEIMRNNALINLNMVHAAADAGVAALLLLLVGLHLPRHGTRRAGADRGRRLPGPPRQRVRLGEALRRAGRRRPTAARYGMPCGSPASRTATGPRAPGAAGARRRRPRSCRKVAEAPDGGAIEVWGDGTAVRSYTYVDDMVDGILRSTQSDLDGPDQHRQPRVRHRRRAGRHRRRGRRQADRHSTSTARSASTPGTSATPGSSRSAGRPTSRSPRDRVDLPVGPRAGPFATSEPSSIDTGSAR